MPKRYTVPDEIVTSAGPEKDSGRLLSVLLVLVPAVAMWHPITAEGPGANLAVFWSWFYCLAGIPLNMLVFVALALVEDKMPSGTLLAICRCRPVVAHLIRISGIAWTLGAAARGWMWTAALLGACWVVGWILRVMTAEAAKTVLVKRHGPDEDALDPEE